MKYDGYLFTLFIYISTACMLHESFCDLSMFNFLATYEAVPPYAMPVALV